MHIPLLSPLIHYFNVFYGYAGKKLYFLCIVIILGGISEGFGISMLLPILNFEQNEDVNNRYSQLIYRFMDYIGLGVSLTSLLVLLFVIFSLTGLFSFIQKTFTSYITTNLEKTLKVGFCEKYADMKYSYYTNTNIGYLNNIITIETGRTVGGFKNYLEVIVSITFISVYVFSSFIINMHITLLVLGICICMLAALRFMSRISRRLSILISEANAQVQSLLIQTIYNFKYLKATNSFTNLYHQLYKKIDENKHYKFKSGLFAAIPISIIEPATVLFLSGLIFYQINYAGRTMSEILVLMFFFYKAFSRIFGFQSIWQKFNASLGGVEVVEKATKELALNKEQLGSFKVKQFEDTLELKEINFRYGSRQVLFDINIVIPKNKSIGIVGESGAGKTTLFDIITGLITPQSGTVRIDERNYSELDLLTLRKIIGYVTQEPVVFNDTISNNISFWKSDHNEGICRERIEKAAKLANCHSFIDKTNGYETIIGDKGIKLSGGQCQRIAIARELFKEPEIMIFDEATSALDSESERFIQESILGMRGKRTIVIIAHRLSTIRSCDYIYVLSKGRIVEKGTFESLRNEGTHFSKMCKAQHL